MMELWHGPTCAFKDVALQFLPRALDASRRSLGIQEKTLILVATSGDTGKAALEGFRDAPGTHCAVFWPEGGVSGVQKLQMLTQRGGNVSAIAVRGNFDDAQTGVKQIFSDVAIQRADESRRVGAVVGQQHQLRQARPADRLLRVGMVRALCRGRDTPERGDRLRGAHGQLRQHPGGMVRPRDGPAGRPARVRLQPQPRAHGLLQPRRLRHPPPVLHARSARRWTSSYPATSSACSTRSPAGTARRYRR